MHTFLKLAILTALLLLFIGISGCDQAEKAKQAVGIEAKDGGNSEKETEKEEDESEEK